MLDELLNHPYAPLTGGLLLLLSVAVMADLIAKGILVRLVHRFAEATSYAWDDALADEKVFGRLAQVVPAVVFFAGIHLVPNVSQATVDITKNVALGYIVLMLTVATVAMLRAGNTIYETYPVSKHRPIKGFIQVAQIVIAILGGVLVLAILIDRSPFLLLSGFGAMTAILLLVFKDTILSLVASVQLTAQDMIRVGDWIEMPQFGADGDVVDVALHTVKVQNWDKTITTIPTHQLISSSYKNWRGMSESGGRRIKRAIILDLTSIRFLTEEEIERYKRFVLLREYIVDKRNALQKYNQRLGAESNSDVNLRRLTNVGTFRAYVYNYLKHHDQLRNDMTLLVRQLQPTPQGLPIEVYVFTTTTAWADYESIQADIFDHLYSILAEFGLRPFQEPTGVDFTSLGAA